MSKTSTPSSLRFFSAPQPTSTPSNVPALPSSLGLGVLLLPLLALGAMLSQLDAQRHNDSLLAAPRTGDVYTVQSGQSHAYSLLKVLRAGGNGVELVANRFQTTDRNPINLLNQDFRYSDEPFIVTRLDLQIMRRQGLLVEVNRP